ncbi:MAG: hypothetical protein GXP42_11765 [Chloroflexi bacterium]|nr:hypothetical protein [Chloroflexota bacterium]
MNRFEFVRLLYRYFGPRWLAFRAAYAARSRLGLIQRQLPAHSWDERPLAEFLNDASLAEPNAYLAYRRTLGPTFFFSPTDFEQFQSHLRDIDATTSSSLARRVQRLSRGELRLFTCLTAKTGFPPNWLRNPLTNREWPANQHWSRLDEFGRGDIKLIWELNRFGFVFDLVRLYARTGDEQLAELFWMAVEDWRSANPPQLGPNWKCGQEITFRVMAWCFGFYAFLTSPATTPERVVKLAHMIALSAERIEANLDYALSQRNNHSISEGVGLWTIGLLFPEFQCASRWRERGRDALHHTAYDLFYDDGAFVQHSFNYHRLALHDLIWAWRIGELNRDPLPNIVQRRIEESTHFLHGQMDRESGRLPHYGQDDGALILPLNHCHHRDFRPAIQAGYFLIEGKRCFERGPWDEDLLWLWGPAALRASRQTREQGDFQAEIGGCCVLRTSSGLAFTRGPTFRHRPGQADALHVDIWWRGQNIAIDPGTYSYNADPPWEGNPLAGARFHNTVTVDDRDQMERPGVFLWLPWLTTRVSLRRDITAHEITVWEGEHDGYQRLPTPAWHGRALVRLPAEHWLVVDRLHSAGAHRYRLHWLFDDFPYQWDEQAQRLSLDTPAGMYFTALAASAPGRISLIRADETSPRGWQAPSYFCLKPALSLAFAVDAAALFFITHFGPEPGRIMLSEQEITLQTLTLAIRLSLNPEPGAPIIVG